MPKLKKKLYLWIQSLRFYHLGNNVVKALDDVSISIYENDFISIMGPSGSGKIDTNEYDWLFGCSYKRSI